MEEKLRHAQLVEAYAAIDSIADQILNLHALAPDIDDTIDGAAQINYFEHLKRYHRWTGKMFIGYGWSEGGDFAGENAAMMHDAEHDDEARWVDHDIDNPIYHTHMAKEKTS